MEDSKVKKERKPRTTKSAALTGVREVLTDFIGGLTEPEASHVSHYIKHHYKAPKQDGISSFEGDIIDSIAAKIV